MNNLKRLKLLVASALLSSTSIYADDSKETSATNCGIKAYVVGNFMDSSDEIYSVSGSFGVMGSF